MNPGAVKPSRLLIRLDADIVAERDPFRADCLRAERAAYLARQGYADDANSELAALHLRHDARPKAEMSAWLSLVESLLSYFSDMGPIALDKMRRSRALSEAAGLTQLQALSAAWLAQMDYLRLDLQALAKNLNQALRLAQPSNHSACSRACLVVALAYHTAVRLDLALPWYTRAREHANAEGDDATISALMHNMAWIRTVNMRNAALNGTSDNGEGEHVLMAAESTWSFDRLVGATSLDASVPLMHAQILSMQGKAALALELYEKYLSAGMTQGLGRLHGTMLADQSWCRLQVGQRELAREDAERAEPLLALEGNSDDRAPGFSRLAQVFASLDDVERTASNARFAEQMWVGHSQTCSKLVEMLGPIVGSGSPTA